MLPNWDWFRGCRRSGWLEDYVAVVIGEGDFEGAVFEQFDVSALGDLVCCPLIRAHVRKTIDGP